MTLGNVEYKEPQEGWKKASVNARPLKWRPMPKSGIRQLFMLAGGVPDRAYIRVR
jgi:hypothetical protein